ncbi:MAG: flagellin [Clostridia bacterium]|nr:flagellin [Clostridia bacterium]
MVIAHNISALNTYKSLGIAGSSMQSSMEKLSSGYKINKAGDDAAGLSISEKMRSQIRGLNQASTNAENGVSMIQTAEGALNEEHSILQRMRELAVQSATDTNAQEDRDALQSEIAQLSSEINRIGATTEFNGMKILNGDKTLKSDDSSAYATKNIGGFKLKALTPGNDITSKEFNIQYFTSFSTSIDYSTTFGDLFQISVSTSDDALLKSTDPGDTTAKQALIDQINAKFNLCGFEMINDASSALTFSNTDVFSFDAGSGNVIDNSVYFHVGANSNQVINTSFNDMRATALGIVSEDADATGTFATTANVSNGVSPVSNQYSLNISTRDGANKAIDIIDDAIKLVSEERSKYGAIQNRLEYTMNNLNTTAENMTAAESTIRDVDMAEEMMEYTKNNILQQAAQAMLVQANARPQQALQLLQ